MNPFSVSIVDDTVSVSIISTGSKTTKTSTVVTMYVSAVELNYDTLSVTFIAHKDSPLSVENEQLLLHGEVVNDVVITSISSARHNEPTTFTAMYETPKPI